MTLKNIWILIRVAASSWIDDYAQSMGAALAYYTMFSIAPLLLIVISIAGLIFGVEAARGEIVGQLQGLMGQQGFEGVLCVDGWAPYRGFDHAQIQTCLAHLLRRSKELHEAPPTAACAAYFGKISAVLQEALALRNRR